MSNKENIVTSLVEFEEYAKCGVELIKVKRSDFAASEFGFDFMASKYGYARSDEQELFNSSENEGSEGLITFVKQPQNLNNKN